MTFSLPLKQVMLIRYLARDLVKNTIKYFPNYLSVNNNHPINCQSPYSASKAASDHLVRSWGRTYNLPVITTNCSNNYGPNQNEEKLIPKE